MQQDRLCWQLVDSTITSTNVPNNLQVPAIPESQPLAGNGIAQLQTAASTGSNGGLQAASSGTMLRTGSTAAAEQRAKNIEVPPLLRLPRLRGAQSAKSQDGRPTAQGVLHFVVFAGWQAMGFN